MTKKIIYLIALLLSVFSFSCSSDKDDLEISNEHYPETKAIGDGLYDALGHGCDVTVDIFKPKPSVLNNEKLASLGFAISGGNPSYSIDDIISGSNASTYLHKISTEKSIRFTEKHDGAGAKDSAAVNSVSFKSKFSDEKKYTSNYSFATINKYILQREYQYTLVPGNLRKYLSDSFMYALNNNYSNETIVAMYGTHVYSHVKLGGKLSIVYRADISSNTRNKLKSVEAGASWLFNKKFGVSVKYDKTEQDSAHNETKDFSYSIISVGGDNSIPKSEQLMSGNDVVTSISTGEWQRSVGSSPKLQQLIDFDPGTLIPIWELVENTQKRESLRLYIEDYIRKVKIEVEPFTTDCLYAPNSIYPGDFLRSRVGQTILTFQQDGNLVLKRDGSVIWHSNTANKGANHITMQDDGNLVMYTRAGKALWGSGTAKKGKGCKLLVHDDGNLVLYTREGKVIWSTDTWR